MKIEFWLRAPGQHTHHSTVDWDAVPRVDEAVFITKDDVRDVHAVEWVLPSVVGSTIGGSVRVLLR